MKNYTQSRPPFIKGGGENIPTPKKFERNFRLGDTAKCHLCKREFNLLNEEEANEWYYGHDCEEQ